MKLNQLYNIKDIKKIIDYKNRCPTLLRVGTHGFSGDRLLNDEMRALAKYAGCCLALCLSNGSQSASKLTWLTLRIEVHKLEHDIIMKSDVNQANCGYYPTATGIN